MSSVPLLCCMALILSACRVEGATPYQDFSQKGTGFFGPGRELEAPDTLSAVRIGLIGPASGPDGRQLRRGVEMAVREANAAGGYEGMPYEIVFRPDDGPWGVVARQAVDLSQEEQVWALIGSLDGARAHAVELVAAKLWIPVITPGAADMTIDYANVPWVFRLMPDDRSQAELLLEETRRRGWDRVIFFTEGTRDGRLAGERLLETARALSTSPVLHIEYDPYRPSDVVPRVHRVRADALLVWGRPEGAVELIEALRREGWREPVLVPSLLVLPRVATRGEALGEVLGAASLDLHAANPRLRRFCDRYRRWTGEQPSYIAAYAYEAARLIIEAIERTGLNRARIRDELARMQYDGLSGRVSFSGLGGYRRMPVLVSLRKGRWLRVADPAAHPLHR